MIPADFFHVQEPEPTETYSVNGVNYTTYTTFRSPITPDDCPESVSTRLPQTKNRICQRGRLIIPPRFRLFSENLDESAETPTTPTNEPGYLGGEDHEDTPHIPEPDYDVSDVDNNSYSGSESSWKDTATLRRNQRNERERKKKKTVSFIMNEELANIIHSSGTMTKKDSILKDPSREKEPVEEPRGRWRTPKRSPTKVAPPMPETPKTPSEPTFNSFFASPDAQKRVQVQQQNGTKNGGQGPAVHPAWEGGSIVEPGAPSAPEPASKLVSTSKIRIEVGSGGGQQGAGTGAKPVHRSNSLQRPSSQHLQKSQSFSSPPSIQKPLFLTPNKMQDAAASGAISQSELQRAKMQLKSSRSYPELLEDGDNSSSGVSSDQDQDSVTMPQANGDFVTQLTVSNGVEPRAWGRLKSQDNDCESNSSGTGSSHSEDLSDKTWILQSESYGPGSQNMLSMQPQEKIKGSPRPGGKTKALSGVVPGRLQEPVQIEWSQPSEEQGQEHHYQNFHAMMKSHKSKTGGARYGRYNLYSTDRSLLIRSFFSNSSLGEHVNVSRPFHSASEHHPMSQSYSEDCTYAGGKITNGSRTKETIMSQSMVHEPRDSRSIEESLALIQHHVKVTFLQHYFLFR